MKSTLTQDKLEEMRRHAVAEYPYECCGVVAGKVAGNEDDVLYRCTNIQNKLHAMDPRTYTRDARTAFYIDPKELMGVLKETEKKGLAIKTFYHSHPDHDAYFSEEDKRMALFDDEPVYPGANYVVISVYNKEVKRTALFAWNPDKKVFEEQTA